VLTTVSKTCGNACERLNLNSVLCQDMHMHQFSLWMENKIWLLNVLQQIINIIGPFTTPLFMLKLLFQQFNLVEAK